MSEPAPAQALAGRDAVVHLAGENVAQRWTAGAKRAIRESRVRGTRHLVEGLQRAEPRPRMLLSASAIGYYGPHGEEPLDEDAPAGRATSWRRCARRGRPRRREHSSWECAWRGCGPAWCSTPTAERFRRCCRRSGSGWAAR